MDFTELTKITPDKELVVLEIDHDLLFTESMLPPARFLLNHMPEAIMEALYAAQGNLTKSARILECSYESLREYIKKNPPVLKYLEDARDIRNSVRMDILEDLAMNKALAGDTSMIKKLLDTHGRDRGYGEKQTISLTGDIPKGVSELLVGLAELRKATDQQVAATNVIS